LAIRTRFFSLLLLVLSIGAGAGRPTSHDFFAALTGATAHQLSPEGQSALMKMIDAGKLSELQCPNFSAYQTPVQNFYESVGHDLVWLHGTELTNQARAVVALLEGADAKGLDPEDYDGPKWAERVQSLGKNSEYGLISFDLALTVSAMRFASDLHLGRVNPHQVGVNYDVDGKRINLAEFLKRSVVDASDVAAAFQQLEPNFPEYLQTEKALQAYEERAEDGDTKKSMTRVNQLALALERWRWIPFGNSQPVIVVNIPEFQLRAYDEEYNPVMTMRVLDGKANGKNDTPSFGGRMQSVIFRPYWNVPASIERAELLPRIEGNPGYISSHAYEVVDAHGRVGGGDVVSGLRSGRLAIRQRPGPHNALGLVKFSFPNEYDVYMHDTPAVKLFSKSQRDLTHGCIRVQKPEELAEWVLRFNSGWGRDEIHAAMEGSRTIPVNLAHPFPVFIVYMTATADENGEAHFFDDIYGLDEALRRALAQRKACSG